VHPLRIALAACVLFVAPAALLAQPVPPQPPQPPNVRPIPPVRPVRPRPIPTGAHRPNPNRSSAAYPVFVDGSVMNRYLATPAPKPTRKPTPRPKNGQDVFETHSTDDNAK
jgi:hypothetical protein